MHGISNASEVIHVISRRKAHLFLEHQAAYSSGFCSESIKEFNEFNGKSEEFVYQKKRQ